MAVPKLEAQFKEKIVVSFKEGIVSDP